MSKISTLIVLLMLFTTHSMAIQFDSENNKKSPPTKPIINKTKPEMIPAGSLKVNLLDFPRRGMSMRQVMNKLGKPKKASMGIGTPPIRHWKYNDRVIYFENTTVIHVVATP